jgi:hypothetical protein
LLQRFFEELRARILKPIKVSPNLENPYVYLAIFLFLAVRRLSTNHLNSIV